MAGKKKARKAPPRNANKAKKARKSTARANPTKAASTRRTARPTNGSLSIGGNLKSRLSEMAKGAGHANWKQFALSLIDNGIKGTAKA